MQLGPQGEQVIGTETTETNFFAALGSAFSIALLVMSFAPTLVLPCL